MISEWDLRRIGVYANAPAGMRNEIKEKLEKCEAESSMLKAYR